jgi:protein-disulfide isomerase
MGWKGGFGVKLGSLSLASVSLAILLAGTIGCKAQTPPTGNTVTDPALKRQIEVMVRGQFNVPAEYNVAIGARTPSAFPGYDSLKITIARGEHASTTDFLISTDNKTLARLETFDLAHNAAQNIPVENRPIRGNPNAKVTIINFDDLECPYCARMHQQLFPATLERYKDKVKFVYKDDPLTEIHPWAMRAAVDANCLADQDGKAYWGYVDYLHSHGQEITGEDRDPKKSDTMLDKIAHEQGKIFTLDSTKLDACLAKQDETAVRSSMKEAESLGVEGTPYLFVDGEHINGALPVEQVWMVIDRALRAAGVEPPPPASPAPSATLGH